MGTNLGGFDTPDKLTPEAAQLSVNARKLLGYVIALNNVRLFNGHAGLLPRRHSGLSRRCRCLRRTIRGLSDLDGETQIIDGHSHFVMPGMVNPAHLSYTNNGPLELDKSPVEEVVIKTIQNARHVGVRVYLRHQFWLGASRRRFPQTRDRVRRRARTELLAEGGCGSTGSNADLHPDYATEN